MVVAGREDARQLDRALVELVLAGLVTGDGMAGLREILRKGQRGFRSDSAFEESLRRPAPSALGSHPGRPALRAAERRVATRLAACFDVRISADFACVPCGRIPVLGFLVSLAHFVKPHLIG